MERRDDIRSAIHTLLTGGQTEAAPARSRRLRLPESADAQNAAYSESQLAALREVQTTLRAHRIEAEIPEIVHVLLETLAARPALCRGLVAEYLLGS